MIKTNPCLHNCYQKCRESEIFRYLISGVCVTFTNLALFTILSILGVPYLWANGCAIITAKILAYTLNKWYVFRCHSGSIAQTFWELAKYIGVRGSTGLIDFFGLMFLVEVLHINQFIGKIFITVLVLVLNYLLGKKVVFSNKQDELTCEIDN